MLVDHVTEAEYTPLAHLGDSAAPFMVYDSVLSEFAALGFEYGYSVADRDALVCWEAQFGDFGNGAQTIIDQFIVAAEDKWGERSGLVMLLPHGFEGQGPSTRRPGSSASSCCAPRTTCASSTPPRPRSTSTCSAARCTILSASR